jgi:hypothetical protein
VAPATPGWNGHRKDLLHGITPRRHQESSSLKATYGVVAFSMPTFRLAFPFMDQIDNLNASSSLIFLSCILWPHYPFG